jgi:hypothetical protein
MNAANKSIIDTALGKTDGNAGETDILLDLHPKHLYRMIRDLFRKS